MEKIIEILKNIEFAKGFRRIFASVSILFLLFVPVNNDLSNAVYLIVIAAANYLLFLFILWIIKGFTKQKMNFKEHFSYKIMFFVLLILCLGLLVLCYKQNEKITLSQINEYSSNVQKEDLNKKIEEQEQIIQQLESIDEANKKEISALKQKNSAKSSVSNGNYFAVGSTKAEVIAAQGQPDEIKKFYDSEKWHYNSGNWYATVTFRNDVVSEYSNYNNILRVTGY